MTYDAAFFAANIDGGLRAAQIVLPDVLKRTNARSVVDVGCAQGAWLSVAKEHGCAVTGIDGFAPQDGLLIDESEFIRCDLSTHITIVDGFDLAICLEVAEHLPVSVAESLVQGLCKQRYVLFSGAHPGQGGLHHINEQWSTYWVSLFAKHGYIGSDDIRWEHWTNNNVHDFYRENMIVFAKPTDLDLAGYRPGVCDVIHPIRLGKWAA